MKKLLLILMLSSPAFAADRDNDGVDDSIDNCMACSNSSQSDVDGDGIGDACDLSSVNMCVDADVNGICDDAEPDPDPTPTETCDDGLQNQDETGVDCGGVCVACPDPDPDPDPDPTCTTEPVRYDPAATHSPITCGSLTSLQDIVTSVVRSDDWVMRVGDSHTVSTNFLNCLSHPHYDVASFTRTSLAAQGGQTASWAAGGPFLNEADASDARFALIMFGTNDLWYGGGPNNPQLKYQWWFDNMSLMLEDALIEGIVPVLYTIPPHEGSNEWFGPLVNTINALVFGLGEKYQVPVVNFHDALLPLPGRGLGGDGIHLNRLGHGLTCDYSSNGLQYGHNMRNYLTEQSLDRLYSALYAPGGPVEFTDGVALPLSGTGDSGTPYAADALPFHHSESIASYYEFTLSQETHVRVVALSTSNDPYLIMQGNEGSRILTLTLAAGTHSLYVDGTDYTLTIVECDNAACAP